eukprot:TRINITY_DN250_c0_g1_i1.p1 TRINITY_DN250_c0_g1~~TRINITY_DN250_c0_g1_i1.p1  ORF type:complete len:149 (+),score=69.67 TRINITY_DN250_c0_g1_i1:67-447(+)
MKIIFLAVALLALFASSSAQLSCSDMQGLVENYIDQNDWNNMLCISYYESSYIPTAQNGSGASGLWQIMPNIWCGQPNCPSCDNTGAFFDADANANCAYTVLVQQGLSAWTTYNNGDCYGWSICTL